ncbi:Conserved_hypothetical protein [Hexamita inflata]|uniref:Uncharacterized protein n=1 Tax=Hexamita inflata TaxID=28002 RepID=A0AA86UL54_9EUKA|nr:Conserved hypothetical protein [Hexamita inflata]
MIALLTSFQLRCFQPNTTVMLDVQTRDAVFKAWPRTDATRETELCGKLKGDMFKLSIQTGAYEYVLNTLQSYDPAKYIEIRLPCTEVVLGVPGTCATAFKAKSAIYTMDFQEAKQNVTEAASNLRKLDFDRKACYQSPRMDISQQVEITPGVFSDQFKFGATTANCKYPLDSQATISNNNPADKKAVLSFYGYPNFTLVAPQYSVSASAFMSAPPFSCANMPPEKKTWCSEMIKTLSTQSLFYFQTNYTVPGLIPDRNGQLTRKGNYTSIMESSQIKNVAVDSIDCYSKQQIKLFSRTLRFDNSLNQQMIQCKKPINELVDFDYMTTRIIFQETKDFRVGTVYQIDFKTPTQVLNVTNEWLPCVQSTNFTYCMDLLTKRSYLPSYNVITQKLFYKDDKIVTILPLTVLVQTSCIANLSYQLSNNEVCALFNQSCNTDLSPGTYDFTYTFGNISKFGSNILNITTQGIYPQIDNRYCVNHKFSDQQIQEYLNEDQTKIVTGSLTIGKLLVPIPVITDVSSQHAVKNIEYIIIGTSVIVTVFVVFSLFKQWL